MSTCSSIPASDEPLSQDGCDAFRPKATLIEQLGCHYWSCRRPDRGCAGLFAVGAMPACRSRHLVAFLDHYATHYLVWARAQMSPGEDTLSGSGTDPQLCKSRYGDL